MTKPQSEATCRACGERMTLVEPDQAVHPGCEDPDAPAAPVVSLHRTLDRKAVTDWLRALHGASPGYLQVCSSDDFAGRTFPAAAIDDAVAHIVALDQRNPEGIYCRVTSLKAPPAKGGRGAAVDTAALPALWADLDIAGPGHKAGPVGALPLPPDEDAGRAIITASGLPEPTVWVHSGGGMYPMWVLTEPHVITDDYDDIRQLAAGWQKIIHHAAKQLGWRYATGVGDLSRVLRVPGTVNRKEGLARRCRMLPEGRSRRYTLDELQLALADGLARIPAAEPSQPAARRATDPADEVFGDGTSPGDDYAAKTDWADILEPHGWRLLFERGRTRYWTRPGKDGGISATTNHLGTDRLHVFSTEAGFDIDDGGTSFSKLAAYATLNHGGDYSAAAKALADQGYGSRRPRPADEAGDEPAPPDDTEIEQFWASRPILTHVRGYALAKVVSPWATLGVVLARVIAETPPHVVLPAIVGSQVSLNLFVALVGDSGAGKGGAEGAASDALVLGTRASVFDEPKPSFDTHGVGSGEGILHAYVVRQQGAVVQHTTAVLFSVPEVDTLSALGDRKGATLMPELRKAWMGEKLDFAYADPTKRLHVERHKYRMSMIVGVQPERARGLLDDKGGGTPQRFVWLPAEVTCPEGCEHTDCDAPDVTPPEPRPWPWKRPEGITGGKRQEIFVCETARNTIIEARLKRLRKNEKKEALDGHALLAQLKVAAALAILNGKLEIHDEDWNDAGLIMRISAGVREEVRQVLRAADKEAWEIRDKVEAKRAVYVEDKVREAAIGRVVRIVRRALARAGAKGLTQPEARRCVSSIDRKFFEEAWERLAAVGDLVEDDSGKAVRYRLRELKEAS